MVKTSEQLIESMGFGRYQLRTVFLLGLSIYFCSNNLMVMTFSTAEPPWKCVENSTSCSLKSSYKPGDKDYIHRCGIPRDAWTFDVKGNFDSIVTEVSKSGKGLQISVFVPQPLKRDRDFLLSLVFS